MNEPSKAVGEYPVRTPAKPPQPPQRETLTRQQKRDIARKLAKEPWKLVELVDGALSALHGRIEVLTEALRLSGVTEDMMKQAEANVAGRANPAPEEEKAS